MCQSKTRDFFFYLEHGIVHKVVLLLIRPLCCQKVCLLTQKQSIAAVISDGTGAQNQIFVLYNFFPKSTLFIIFYPTMGVA